jgi:hypothetical protein
MMVARIISAAVGLPLAVIAVAHVCDAGELYGSAPDNMGVYLDRLVSSYPSAIKKYDEKFLYLTNGSKYRISDGRVDKTFEELLERPDIDDMFYLPYPVGQAANPPAKNEDPGRVRFEPLFTAMYGNCSSGEVVPKLRSIAWLPKHHRGSVSVTRANGVDVALEAVSNELDELGDRFLKYLSPTAGSYNCRNIAGMDAKSMHSYGAAIDINAAYSGYWRWSASHSDPKWRNQIPIEIVRIFEKHGFIWGGRWYHYDTMHFEYRPELLRSP